MIIRYPDDCSEDDKANLPNYFPQVYIAQAKMDGWSTFVIKDSTRKIANPSWARGKNNDLYFISRRAKDNGGPTLIEVKPDIVKSVENLDIPDQSMLMGEWMARRTIGECPEMMFPFDVLWWSDKWMGCIPYQRRYEMLGDALRGRQSDSLQACLDNGGNSITTFFQSVTQIPITEGVMLKRKDAMIKGDRVKRILNGSYTKVKWRSGASGRNKV